MPPRLRLLQRRKRKSVEKGAHLGEEIFAAFDVDALGQKNSACKFMSAFTEGYWLLKSVWITSLICLRIRTSERPP